MEKNTEMPRGSESEASDPHQDIGNPAAMVVLAEELLTKPHWAHKEIDSNTSKKSRPLAAYSNPSQGLNGYLR
jgi:hypothetical protein